MEVDSELIGDMQLEINRLFHRITVMQRFFEADVVRPLEAKLPHEQMTREARSHYGEIKFAMKEIKKLRQCLHRVMYPAPNDNTGGQ